MSWQDRINNEYRITTGDGQTYIPLWMNASKVNEYNVSEFEFPGVEGTLVSRGTVKGRKFALEIFFMANGRENNIDHLDESELFEASARDSRPWTIDHPFYGVILVQPVSLTFDNKEYNITRITGTVIETLENAPKINVDPFDNSRFLKTQLDNFTNQSFTSVIPVPSTFVINQLTTYNLVYYDTTKLKIKDVVNAQDYFNLFNEANAAIVNATAEPLEAIRAMQAFINAPYQFIDSVKNRVNMFRAQFAALVDSVSTIVTTDHKKIFENNGVTIISATTQAAIINTDYRNRIEVVTVIEQIINDYNSFMTNLDVLQTENGGSEDSFIPNAESIIGLSYLINFTVSNLFAISLTTKQQRTIVLEDDTNLILLAHRLYGLTADDQTITDLINDNIIGLNEMLGIRKGRKIVYYI